MRRITFALLLLSAAGWAGPSRAQWWGWERPCIGVYGPGTCAGGGWAQPGRVVELIPVRRPWAWGWRRWAWQREMRLRRIENWRRWVEASRQAEPVAEPRPPLFRRRVRASPFPLAMATRAGEPRPEARARARLPAPRPPVDDRPAVAAVALMPGAARFARSRFQAPVSPPLLAAAARRPALPPTRPAPVPPVAPAALRMPEAAARPEPAHRALRPAVLRSEPAPAVADPIVRAAPAAPAAAEPIPAAPADVPVAPLD